MAALPLAGGRRRYYQERGKNECVVRPRNSSPAVGLSACLEKNQFEIGQTFGGGALLLSMSGSHRCSTYGEPRCAAPRVVPALVREKRGRVTRGASIRAAESAAVRRISLARFDGASSPLRRGQHRLALCLSTHRGQSRARGRSTRYVIVRHRRIETCDEAVLRASRK